MKIKYFCFDLRLFVCLGYGLGCALLLIPRKCSVQMCLWNPFPIIVLTVSGNYFYCFHHKSHFLSEERKEARKKEREYNGPLVATPKGGTCTLIGQTV